MTWQSRIKPANWRSIWLCSIKGNGYWVFFLFFYCYCIYYANSSSKSLWQIDSCRKKNVMLLFGVFFPTQLIASWIQTNGDTILRLSSLTLYHDHDNSDGTKFWESTEILPTFCWDSIEILLTFYWESAGVLLRIYWESLNSSEIFQMPNPKHSDVNVKCFQLGLKIDLSLFG